MRSRKPGKPGGERLPSVGVRAGRPRSRPVSATTILTDEEVATVVRAVPELLGEDFASAFARWGSAFEDQVRFGPVARRCLVERERRGWTRKDVAVALRVPQYRVQDIERGWASRLQPELVPRYLAHLGLQRWFRRWREANPALATRMGWSGPQAARYRTRDE